MVYFIRTPIGDSTTSCGGLQDIPFQGSCQGNGVSPGIWLVISIYLVLLMKEEGHMSEVKSPISGITLVLVGFLFVDDTNLVIFGNKKDPAIAVHDRLQKAIYCWNGVLRISGGALKSEKFYWYFAQFSWTEGKWSLK